MTLRGKGINVQVLTECICYLLFGFLLFHLTYSGRYLNYVTPRMKPYLYGMAAFMLLWAVMNGRYLLTPQYRAKLARSFVFIIPILLLALRPAAPGGGSMVRSYDSETGLALVEQRNKMTLGDEIEVFGPGGVCFRQQLDEMYDAESGEAVSSAPHPQQLLLLRLKQPCEQYFMLRKRKEERC